jgi:bacteriocin biosynthesis cyclodehydratase domain-containing protein
MPAQPHLLVDISYHHTLALGPYVVPGQTACVYCLGNRVLRRWGEAVVPTMPAVAAQPARIAALVAPLLDQPALLLGYLERSVWLDLHRLHGERDRVLRLPWCPACQGGATWQAEPLSLPWRTGRPV